MDSLGFKLILDAAASFEYCAIDSAGYIGNWMPLVTLVLVATISILSLLYSISSLLGGAYGRRLRIYIKEEALQVVISLVLLSAIFAVLTPACKTLTYLASSAGFEGDPIRASQMFLNELLFKGVQLYARGYIFELMFISVGGLFQTVPSMTLMGEIKCEGFSYGGYADFAMTVHSILDTFISFAYLTLFFWYLVLEFTRLYAFNLLLPLAVLLRSFSPAREGSDFFVALAIGLYIFLPAMVLMDAYIVNNIKPLDIHLTPTGDDAGLYNFFAAPLGAATKLGFSAFFSDLFHFSRYLQEVAYFDFITVFLMGLNLVLLNSFVDGLARVLSAGFGSLTTRISEAYGG